MVSRPTRLTPPLECVRLFDPATGLDGVIAIHSLALGPGAGGCRFWDYPHADDLLADALRLAEGMSYKNALAGLPFGGAKAVLRRPAESFDRATLFRAFGRAVDALGGNYVTAEDVGTSVADMQEVARQTRHVAGLPFREGRAGGNPSPWTARGVFEAMRVGAERVFERELSGLTVAVQGTGQVGTNLCRLLADAGARLIIADPNPLRRDRLKHILDAQLVDSTEIAAVEADIFAPCALSGALNEASVAAMKARLVCGAANNQLAVPAIADRLMARGITYIPDYVANAGGIISVAAEYLAEKPDHVAGRVDAIAPRVAALLDRAALEGRSPALVADEMAEEVIAGVGRRAA
ncbi:Leu/Phe/Val dehydrogenase [Sphingopyxis sp. MWB1]|uniref:Leu/Phe/Val dehydrogenase n=1 Tax=Sphingopyxis sp. MWB1 TaxID=1537715 RepID=UPI000519F99B|nr:Glu/Leu/Phe/Val dehydrogenase dimerization domain-containing protein [Sphingopyxis sp. MWB1]